MAQQELRNYSPNLLQQLRDYYQQKKRSMAIPEDSRMNIFADAFAAPVASVASIVNAVERKDTPTVALELALLLSPLLGLGKKAVKQTLGSLKPSTESSLPVQPVTDWSPSISIDTARITDAGKLSKALKISETFAQNPTLGTVKKLEDLLVSLPSTNKRTKEAINEVLETVLRPKKVALENADFDFNAARSRMRKAGFDTSATLARGQDVDVHRFIPPHQLRRSMQDNQGIFSSKSGEYASWYAGERPNSAVYPVYLRTKNSEDIFDATNPQHLVRLGPAVKHLTRNTQDWKALEQESVQKALKKAGFKGFYTDEAIGPYGNIAMFSGKDIKSKFSRAENLDTVDFMKTITAAALLPLLSQTDQKGE